MPVSGADMIGMAKAVLEADPAYAQISELESKLEPWVSFCREIEGSEVGDAVYAIYDSVGPATSAQEYGLALFLLEYLRQYFLIAKDSDWWAESIDDREHERIEDTQRYNPNFLTDTQKKTYHQRMGELPDLS